MGVLLTGAAGSGKAALVEAVAHDVGARLSLLWAPALAATETNAAAEQLVDTLTRAARESPAVARPSLDPAEVASWASYAQRRTAG